MHHVVFINNVKYSGANSNIFVTFQFLSLKEYSMNLKKFVLHCKQWMKSFENCIGFGTKNPTENNRFFFYLFTRKASIFLFCGKFPSKRLFCQYFGIKFHSLIATFFNIFFFLECSTKGIVNFWIQMRYIFHLHKQAKIEVFFVMLQRKRCVKFTLWHYFV